MNHLLLFAFVLSSVAYTMDQKALITKKERYFFQNALEHKNFVYDIAFNPTDSNELVSNSRDLTIKVWDVSKNICKQTFNKDNKGSSCALSQDGAFIAYGHKNNTISVIDKTACTTKKIVGPQDNIINHIEEIRFHPKNSSCLASCLSSKGYGFQDIITIFNLQNDTHVIIKAYETYDLQIEPLQGKNIIVGSKTSSKIYDIETQKLVHESHDTCGTQKLIFNPQNLKECLFYDAQRSYAQIYDTTNNQLIRSFYLKYNDKPILLSAVIFHPNGKELIVTTHDQTHIFDVLTGNYIESLPNKATFFGSIAQSISNKFAKIKKQNGVHTDKILGSAISSDGKTIATHALDNTIQIWEHKK